MLPKIGRWTTLVLIAVGYLLVQAVAVGFLISIYEESTRESTRPFAGQIVNLTVTRQGQIAYVKYAENYNTILTNLSGEPIADIRVDSLNPASVSLKRDLLIINDHDWQTRVATFVTKPHDDVIWTLVLDQPTLARIYFTAVAVDTRRVVGYLGRRGFQESKPHPAEMITFQYQHQTPYYFLMSMGFTFETTAALDPNIEPIRARFPQWPVVSEGRLLVVDFEKRTVTERPEFGECDSISVIPGPQYYGPVSHYLVVQKDRLILDPLGTPRPIVIPPRLMQVGFSLYVPDSGDLVAMEGQIYTDPTIHITQFNAAGQISQEQDLTTPTYFRRYQPPSSRQQATFAGMMLPVPTLVLSLGFLFMPGEIIPWCIAAAISSVLGFVVLAFICRRLGILLSRGWMAAALLFGPAAGIALWATHRRNPATDLAVPVLTGGEIFG